MKRARGRNNDFRRCTYRLLVGAVVSALAAGGALVYGLAKGAID